VAFGQSVLSVCPVQRPCTTVRDEHTIQIVNR
jgi:hypothetical protein